MLPYRRKTYSRRYPVTTTFKWGRKGYSRGATARALGSARASKAGQKVNYFNCTVCGNVEFLRVAKDYYSDVCCFYPCIGKVDPATGIIKDAEMGSVYGGIVNDRSFRLNCAQYDEFRIVSMKVKINMANTEDGTMTLCSIADRQADRDEVEMDESAMTDIDNDVPSFREVCESQGSIKTIINKNRITPVVRSVYAKDMKEKIDFTDCSIEYATTPNASPLDAITFENYPNFSPAIYFCIQFSKASQTNSTFTFGYTVEYNVIFRNPKSDLQTFIIKEDPAYVNPATKTAAEEARKGITRIASTDPYIPDIVMKNGKETNISWLQRYLARVSLRRAKRVNPDTAYVIKTPATEGSTKTIAEAAPEQTLKQQEAATYTTIKKPTETEEEQTEMEKA